MLVEIAIGDAFGAGYEFQPDRPVNLVGYRQHPKHLLLRPGMYTDDGQMSLAVAEVLLETNDPSMLDFANAFIGCYHRDKRDGYARGFQDFLENTRSGLEFIHKIRPYSDRSGAAMRAVPIGVLPDPEQVKNVARLQAVLTHNSDGGIHAAMAVALASHYLYYNKGHPTAIGEFITQHLRVTLWTKRYEEVYSRKPGNNGMECALAAIHCVQRNDTISDAILSAVQMGGDTDTVAAIVGGLGSIDRHMPKNLPQKLFDDLEDGAYGKTYLRQIDEKLLAKYPRQV